jgi:hypothetical protein
MDNHYNLKFQDFPITFSPIYIKEGAVTYRYSSSSDPKTAILPRFFTELEGAKIYESAFRSNEMSQRNGDYIWVCIFKNLKLLDIRMLKYMIMEEMQSLTEEQLNESESGRTLRSVIETFMIAYGLVPISRQSNLPNFNEPLQNYGYRKSITSDDDISIALMKRILYPDYDGYISPALGSLTDNTKTNLMNELCLFNPSASIRETYKYSNVDMNLLNNLNTKDLKMDILKDYHYFNSNTESIGLILTEQIAGKLNVKFPSNLELEEIPLSPFEQKKNVFQPIVKNKPVAAAWANTKVNNMTSDQILDKCSKQINILKSKIQNHLIYDSYYNK